MKQYEAHTSEACYVVCQTFFHSFDSRSIVDREMPSYFVLRLLWLGRVANVLSRNEAMMRIQMKT